MTCCDVKWFSTLFGGAMNLWHRITVQCTPFHSSTLHSISWQCIALHSAASHHITSKQGTLHYIPLQCTTSHHLSSHRPKGYLSRIAFGFMQFRHRLSLLPHPSSLG
eukprot:15120057-Alexandrium_andersonii.AAC.1